MKKVVVFASGSGSNFQAIIDAVNAGEIQAEIAGLISNKSEAGALQRATNNSIPTTVCSPEQFESTADYEKVLLQKVESWKPDLIVLAGYLRKIPDQIIAAYRGSIINIHPSLLPKYGGKGFYGMNVHRAVLENNETESGCTIHIVDEEFDQGPIIAQSKVAVHSDDTPEILAKRVLHEEHKLLPATIKKFLN